MELAVANLELCRTLYDITRWNGTTWSWYCDEERDDTPVVNLSEPLKVVGGVGYFDLKIPAYDLAYLLRKLPEATYIYLADKPFSVWVAQNNHVHPNVYQRGKSPEDAAAQLAVELFKPQGALYPWTPAVAVHNDAE